MSIKKNKTRKMITMNLIDVSQTLQTMHITGQVISADISAAWIEVGEGNVLRLEVDTDTYVAFSDSSDLTDTVGMSTTPAVKLKTGMRYVICSAKYVRASSNPLRVELLDV